MIFFNLCSKTLLHACITATNVCVSPGAPSKDDKQLTFDKPINLVDCFVYWHANGMEMPQGTISKVAWIFKLSDSLQINLNTF